MKELCEVVGIKFYDTPEMGIACRVSEINRAITGQANRNNFKQDMLDYEYVKNAFPDPAVRKNQIQYLEYNGTGKNLFISLKLVLFHLESGSSHKYKKGWDRVLQAIKEDSVLNSTPCFTSIKEILPQIEENFPHLKNSPTDSDTTLNSGTTSFSKQPLLPTMEEDEYSFLYIAKAGIVDASSGNVTNPLDIHFGITAGDPKDRIKLITRGSYRAQLVVTIAFRGVEHRSDGSKIPCNECAALETWFKNNPEWVNIRGSDESFRYEDPWEELLKEIEASPNTGHHPYSLYPDSPIIRELVPEHLISKVHDFGESLEMIEIARLYKGNVIPDENNLSVSFDGDWIVVQGLHRVKKR